MKVDELSDKLDTATPFAMSDMTATCVHSAKHGACAYLTEITTVQHCAMVQPRNRFTEMHQLHWKETTRAQSESCLRTMKRHFSDWEISVGTVAHVFNRRSLLSSQKRPRQKRVEPEKVHGHNKDETA